MKMSHSVSSSLKEIDVDFLVFVERYATDLLKWDILTFFGRQPDFVGSIEQLAHQMGRSSQSIRPEVGNFVLLGVLEQTQTDADGMTYRLTQSEHLRTPILQLGETRL